MIRKMRNLSFNKLNIKLFVYFIIPIIFVMIITATICTGTMSKNIDHAYRRQLKAEAQTITESREAFYKNNMATINKVDFVSIQQFMLESVKGQKSTDNVYYFAARSALDSAHTYGGETVLGMWLADFETGAGFSNRDYSWTVTADDWNIEENEWYEQANDTYEVFVTKPYKSGITKEMTISIIEPVWNKKLDKALGVIGMDLSVDVLYEIIDSNIYNDGSYAIIITDDGDISFYKDKSYMHRHISDISEFRDIEDKLKKEFDDVYDISIGNEKVRAYFAKMKEGKYTTIAVMPMHIINAEIREFTNRILYIFGFIIVLLIAILTFLSNRIVRPIKEITKQAEKVYSGTYEGALEVTSNDEIGNLVRVFNKSMEMLRYRAEYDPITKVYNVDTLYYKISKTLANNKDGKYVALSMDLANFKIVNDLYGWNEGNRILAYVGGVLSSAQEITLCGRIGNDVYGILIECDSRKQLIAFIHTLSEKILNYSTGYRPKAYFGICPIHDTNIEINILFDWAKLALNTIKGNILVNYAFYDNNIRKKIIEEKEIENEMEHALREGQFTIYFQPKCDIATSRIIGAEALVRWIHPIKGIIYPDKFIPVFEKDGFIIPLDEYVWEQVCIAMSEWIEAGYDIIPISVNVSRLHIHDAKFFSKIVGLANKYNVPYHLLELEFTESALLEDEENMYKIMLKLRETGFTVSMDDFGSGYSSLNMLKNGPLDVVKIDREFLNETVESANGKAIVRGAIAIAKELDMSVVAEGVENEEQARFLLESGCSTAQGYYYSRPLDQETFVKLAFIDKRLP